MRRAWDNVWLLLVSVCASCLASDLAAILRQRLANQLLEKRAHDDIYDIYKREDPIGNPCPEPEKPFPCKNSPVCLPMGYLCDNNYDCEDGYDEDVEVCTAAKRPPIEDIEQFLYHNQKWIVPNMFGGHDISLIAHSLAVSETVSEFKRRVGLTSTEAKTLQDVLKAIQTGDKKEVMELVKMPSGAWNEVQFVFGKIIKSGFQ